MKRIIFAAVPIILFAAALLPGCASSSSGHASASGPSGQRLWAQNCARCHNLRSPSEYSHAQWDVAMLHMRIRANLTAEEHWKIREFLQTGE